MLSYQDVLQMIRSALSERPVGSQVQVENHESAEIALLDYIELVRSLSGVSTVREAHAKAKAEDKCTLYWSEPFGDLNYTWVIHGYDDKGTPAEILLLECTPTALIVATRQDATLNAIALPYSSKPEEILE